jgi:hypothetical protein
MSASPSAPISVMTRRPAARPNGRSHDEHQGHEVHQEEHHDYFLGVSFFVLLVGFVPFVF